MSRRLSITLPDEVVEKIEALAQGSGKPKSEVVRELLVIAGISAAEERSKKMAEALKRAAALRARQTKEVDVVALLHEQREERDRQIEEALRGSDE